jgi:hypothetical protein
MIKDSVLFALSSGFSVSLFHFYYEMSNRYRGPSIDAFYQVSVHLAEGFQRRRLKCEKLMDDRRRTPSDGKSSRCLWQGELKYQPIRNKN